MSEGQRIPLMQAEALAREWVERLQILCIRVEIAGSIRRRKSDVADIEICAIPNLARAYDLMSTLGMAIANWLTLSERQELKHLPAGDRPAWLKAKALDRAAAEQRWFRVKGEYPGRYVQLALPQGICLDLFLCTPENWGLNFLIRTGSAEFSAAFAALSKKQGYIWSEARVYRRGVDKDRNGNKIDVPIGEPLPLPEEADVFTLFGVRWVPPEQRVDGAALWKAAPPAVAGNP